MVCLVSGFWVLVCLVCFGGFGFGCFCLFVLFGGFGFFIVLGISNMAVLKH